MTLNGTEQFLRQRREVIERLKGEIDADSRRHVNDKQKFDALVKSLDDKVVESKFDSAAAIESLLAEDIDVDAEAAAITEFDKLYHAREQRLLTLSAETKDESYDEDSHLALQEEVQLAKIALAEMNQQLGGLAAEVSKLETDIATRKELEKQLQGKLDRTQNLRTLEKLFKASGFVNYVSSVYLNELCHAANKRFQKLTRRQLRLEVTENNTFQVRDFLNDGQVRSAKTLSGGQTFQASLSLALALSDNVQELAGAKQNFFFLDEGFGTLDKESLRTVFDTLKRLRKENRIVGVISHVEALQEEIDVALRISNDEERGSEVS